MIKLILNWYRTKKLQAELKVQFFSAIVSVIQEQKDIKILIENTYNTLKNTPPEEFQQKLAEQIASLVHESNERRQQNIHESI